MAISIELPWPPSVNRYWRHNRGRTHISDEGQRYRKAVCGALAGCQAISGRLCVELVAYPPDKRRRDLDNLPKAILDALQHAGVYEDDSAIDSLLIVRQKVVKGGKMVVTVGGMGEAKEQD